MVVQSMLDNYDSYIYIYIIKKVRKEEKSLAFEIENKYSENFFFIFSLKQYTHFKKKTLLR